MDGHHLRGTLGRLHLLPETRVSDGGTLTGGLPALSPNSWVGWEQPSWVFGSGAWAAGRAQARKCDGVWEAGREFCRQTGHPPSSPASPNTQTVPSVMTMQLS